MSKMERNPKVTVRQDVRYPQLSELSMIYEGANEDISVRFRLARTGVLIQTRCEVRYCIRGVGIGVEFLDASPEITRAIEEEISVQTANK